MKFTSLLQLNEIIVGTAYFLIIYGIYGFVKGNLDLFNLFYTAFAFLIIFGTMNIIYNYYIFEKTMKN